MPETTDPYAVSAFVDLCVSELALCGVREGEAVAVLSQGRERLEYADAFLLAARRLGAVAYHVRVPDPSPGRVDGVVWTIGVTELARNRAAVQALARADLVIDLLFMLFSPEQLEIQAAGARILLVVEPIDVLARLLPTLELRARVQAGEELLSRARRLRVTSPAGTDISYRLGQYSVIGEYGYTDTPGRWDHWPSGFLFTNGNDGGVDGRVVLAPGDIVIAPFRTYVTDRVTITVERGHVVEIRGSGTTAGLLTDYMDEFADDPRRTEVAHIGWGCNERARWSRLATAQRGFGMEARAFHGCVMFATGPNAELGGTNTSACHLDIPMRGCSLYLDDEPVLLDGEFQIAELGAPGLAAVRSRR
ncbi:MAG: leucyl aminopeptidase [Solirubrobacteraceae bacterium]